MHKITVKKYTSKKKNAKKSDDTWYYRFQASTLSATGGRRYIRESGFATKAEAEEAAEIAYRREYAFGGRRKREQDISEIVLKNYIFDVWLPINLPGWQSSTVHGYMKLINGYIIPQFGLVPMCDIRLDMLQKFFDSMYLDSSISLNTLNNLRALMSQILRFAVNNRHIDFNPMDALKKPNTRVLANIGKRKSAREVITSEVIEQILSRFPYGTSAHLPIMLCLHAGLREGEALALCWDDISFEKHCIFVKRQMQRRSKDFIPSAHEKALMENNPVIQSFVRYISNPKYNSKRVVPLSPELESLLMKEKERQTYNRRILGNHYKRYYYTRITEPSKYPDIEKFNRCAREEYENGILNECGEGYELDFVNRTEDGKLLTDAVLKHLCRVIHGKENEEAISETFNIHSLRHTYASNLRASGVREYLVQGFLGHKSSSETQTYMHIGDNELREFLENR